MSSSLAEPLGDDHDKKQVVNGTGVGQQHERPERTDETNLQERAGTDSKKPTRYDKLSTFQKYTYNHIHELIKLLRRRDANLRSDQFNDWAPRNWLAGSRTSAKLARNWLDELRRTNGKKQRKPNLFRAIARTCCGSYLLAMSCLFLSDLVFEPAIFFLAIQLIVIIGHVNGAQEAVAVKTLNISLQNRTVSTTFQADQTEELAQSYTDLYKYASMFLVSLISFQLLGHPYAWLCHKQALSLRVALSELIYGKILRVSRFQRQEQMIEMRTKQDGSMERDKIKVEGRNRQEQNHEQALNLITRDLESFEDYFNQLGWAFVGPIQCVVFAILISRELDWATSLVAFILNGLFGFQRSFINLRLRKYGRLASGVADKRKQLVDETLGSIRLVRMCAWTKPLELKIDQNRREELRHRKQHIAAKSYDIAMFFIAAPLASLLALLFAHYLRGIPFSQSMMSQLFLATATYRRALARNLSTGLSAWAQVLVILDRCQRFLSARDRTIRDQDDQLVTCKSHFECELNELTLTWNDEHSQQCLRPINMNIKPGEFVLVAGQVGSGKSSLLELMLGELMPTSGSIRLKSGPGCGLAYAGQRAWIYSGSVRENILLGRPFQLDRYFEVLRVCALLPDLCTFPDFDRTRIGERGVTLSGGQKARVNLARALYQQAQIYLLDDPLSAVDSHVSSHIFREALRGFLRTKTVILVTHQLQFMNQVDKVLYLAAPSNDHNQQSTAYNFFGTYEELKCSNVLGELLAQSQLYPKVDEPTRQEFKERSIDVDRDYAMSRIISSRLDESTTAVSSEQDEMHKINESRRNNQGHVLTSKVLRPLKFYLANAGTCLELLLFIFVNITMRLLFLSINIFLNFWAGFQTVEYSARKLGPFDLWVAHLSASGALSCAWLIWVVLSAVSIIRAKQFFVLGYRVAKNVHRKLIESLLSTKLSFFDRTPQGHLINRLASDISYMDSTLLYQMDQLTVTGLSLSFVFFSIVLSLPKMLLVVMLLGKAAFWVFHHLADLMELIKYLDGFRRADLYSHVGTTLDGLPVIRSAHQSEASTRKFKHLLDQHSSVRFLTISIRRLIIGAINWIMITFYIALTIFLVYEARTGNGLYAFVSLNLIVQIIRLAQNTLVVFVEFYLSIQSMDRIREYSLELEDEKIQLCGPYIELSQSYMLDIIKKRTGSKRKYIGTELNEAHFTEGRIEFRSVSLKYLHTNKLVLDNVSFKIRPGSKVGIIGRTGAGKTSLATVLFHLYHFEGFVYIDQQDTKQLKPESLRSAISIIPQDPSLFTGTIRHNLDPFGLYSDERIWRVLQVVRLKPLIGADPRGLSMLVDTSGSNFSVGQRQLICLARAILKENKILVLDEATSNIDQETDAQIQQAIKSEFSTCTVLTIAHRLSTVIDLDMLMILQDGQMVEFGTPRDLLAKGSRGLLAEIIDSTGEQQAKLLKEQIMASNEFPKLD